MADPKSPSRDVLAKFLSDHESIKKFERLFEVAGDLTPTDVAILYRLTQESFIEGSNASAKAQSALDILEGVVNDLTINTGIADSKATQALNELRAVILSLSLVAYAPPRQTDNAAALDYIDFNANPKFSMTPGRVHWGPTGTLEIEMGGGNITQQVGEEIFVYGKATAAITEGQLIMVTGALGASGVLTFAPTATGLTDPNAILGVATENLALNAFGRVTIIGIVHGINTTGSSVGEVWADGDVLWYNPSFVGGMTKVKPSAPNMKTQVAIVINAGGGGSGSLQVEVLHGSTLGGTDSNVQLGALVDKQLLQYDAAAGYWKNVAATTAAVTSVSFGTTGLTPNTPTGGAVTVSGTLSTANGGTSLTGFVQYGIMRASTTTALTTANTFAYDGTTFSIGRTPLAWGGSFSVVDGAGYSISSDGSASNAADFASNAYRTSAGAWSYGATNTASRYEQKSGAHTWYSAPSGTINTAITWTNEMVISLGHNWSLGETATNLFYTGASHVISTRNSVTTGTKLLEIGVGTVVPGVAFFFGNNSSAPNTANSAMKIGLMGLTSRSINAAGTINASGADYAEYMRKGTAASFAKGDIVGIDANGELTEVFADAVSFAVKSTNPSYVGGDTWGDIAVVGRQPDEPIRILDTVERRLVSPAIEGVPELLDEDGEVLQEAVDSKEAVFEEFVASPGETDADWGLRWKSYLIELDAFNARMEEARSKVDRIAFAGQVPVNVFGAAPGQYIIPRCADGCIVGEAVSSPGLTDYMAAVGKVIAIEPDGRARIIVKIS